MERKIIGIGEIVFDIIFKNFKPIEAKAGGSILNMLVSLSRLGVPVTIISDMNNDIVGKLLQNFMNENGINTNYIYWHNEGRSRLALAFLNDKNDAEYLFYKMQNEQVPVLNFPKIKTDDLLLFGSYYSIKPNIRHIIEDYLLQCKKKSMIILYDPNFRKSHLNMLNEVMPYILNNISISSIVKGSIEDFELIFNTNDLEKIWQLCKKQGCKHLIITQGSKPVVLFTNNLKKEYFLTDINPLSTIGAGDAFMSGLAYATIKLKITDQNINNISQDLWDKIISFAIACSNKVCLSYDNYLSNQEAQNLKQSFI
jgi:fructokinase